MGISKYSPILISTLVTTSFIFFALDSSRSFFVYHPILMSLAVFFFYPIAVISWLLCKRKIIGLRMHSFFAQFGTLCLLLGLLVIFKHKLDHGNPHFSSAHAIAGGVCILLASLQGAFGALSTFAPRVLGGPKNAQRVRVLHKNSGMTVLFLLTVTAELALFTKWAKRTKVMQHSLSALLLRLACFAPFVVTYITQGMVKCQTQRREVECARESQLKENDKKKEK